MAPAGAAGAEAVAFVSRNFGAAAVSPVVPVAAGAVPVVPAVPVVQAVGAGAVGVVTAALEGASFRHPVTVIFRSAPGVAAGLCCEGVVCAVIAAAVAKPTIPVNTPVQIVFFIRPPW